MHTKPWAFTIPASPVNNLLEYLISHKALMIFHNKTPNSHVPVFLEFLVNALSTASHSKSPSKTYCKSHTQSPENSLYLLLNNIDLVTDSSCIKI